MPRDTRNGEEGDPKRFWQSKTDERSQFIFISFVLVIIFMLIVVISMGAYGYYSWLGWKEGPQIRVDEGLFEFSMNDTHPEADITIHLTLINQGEKESGSVRLEWLVMESTDAKDNIVFESGSLMFQPITSESTRKETFDVSLPQGDYVIAYRVYDDQLFSYEARQNIFVRSDDVSSESPETISVPEFPVLMVPILIILLIFALYRRRYS